MKRRRAEIPKDRDGEIGTEANKERRQEGEENGETVLGRHRKQCPKSTPARRPVTKHCPTPPGPHRPPLLPRSKVC